MVKRRNAKRSHICFQYQMAPIALVEMETLGGHHRRTDQALPFSGGIIPFKLAASIPPVSVPKIHYRAEVQGNYSCASFNPRTPIYRQW